MICDIIKRILPLSVALVLSAAILFKVSAASPVNVTAEACILIEADSGEVVFRKEPDKRLPMASTTKIMTALVAIENGDLNKTVKVSPEAVGVEGSSMYLKAGEELPLSDLLYGLMLQSANDAAAAIACEIGGSLDGFVCLMNERAERLELSDTHFTNPHGLHDEAHYTTASDLAAITREALRNETFRQIVSTKSMTLSDGKRTVVNHNKLLSSYEGAVGVKTGFTKKSGRCLVSAASRDGVDLIAVTLNAPSDWEDHRKLLDLGFDSFEHVSAAEPNSILHDMHVIGGDSRSVRLYNRDGFSVTLSKGKRVVTRIEADRYLPAPISEGDALARAVFYVDGEEIGSIPLFAEHSVAETDNELSLFERIVRFFGR